MSYILSVSLTLLVELVFALLWGIRKRDLLLVALANVLTNPLVNLAHGLLLPHGVLLHTLLPELWAVGTEAVIYCRRENKIPRPCLFAVLANVLSYGTGVVLQGLL